MIDRLFTAVLAFTLLAGGTAAIGSALFAPAEPATREVIVLPAVEVTVQRIAQHAQSAQIAQNADTKSVRQ